MWSRIQIRFPKKLLCCWSFPGASWNGWTRSDWKTKPKPTTAMAGDSPQDDNRREYAIGSDHQGRYRNFAVFGRVLKCQLRAENVKKDAAQGGGVDTDSPRSETQ